MNESAPEFSVGDVVALKSGGPQMTVVDVFEPDGTLNDEIGRGADPVCAELRRRGPITCRWFHEGKLHDVRFSAVSLVKVQP